MLIANPVNDLVLSYFPFFYEAKLAIIIWLLFFGGSAVVYEKCVGNNVLGFSSIDAEMWSLSLLC